MFSDIKLAEKSIPIRLAFSTSIKLVPTVLGMGFQHGKLVPGAFSLVWSLVALPLVPETCEKCPSVTRFTHAENLHSTPSLYALNSALFREN